MTETWLGNCPNCGIFQAPVGVQYEKNSPRLRVTCQKCGHVEEFIFLE